MMSRYISRRFLLGKSIMEKTQKERIQELTNQLEAGVVEVFERDVYKACLHC